MLLFMTLISIEGKSQSWQSLGTGVNFSVYALEVDTVRDELYVGGWFTHAGGISCNGIAKWDGLNWYSLLGGCNFGGNINTIYYFNDQIYVGGRFDSIGGIPARNIAKWNHSTWQALGDGFNRDVHSISSFNGNIYAGGSFDSSGNQNVNNIAQWDGSDWNVLGSGVDGPVYSMINFGNELVVGGNFIRAGTINSAGRIAKWNGSDWYGFGNGFNNYVFSFYVHDGELYASGAFANFSPPNIRYISRWDGSIWQPVSYPNVIGAMTPAIRDMITFNGQLMFTGNFTTPRYIATYLGSSIDSLEHGLSWAGSCLEIYKSELIVGGYFSYAGYNIANTNSLARWVLNPSIIENSKDYQQVYLNTSNGSHMIVLPFGTEPKNSTLKIFDLQGRLTKEIKWYEEKYLQVKNIPSGVYIYQFKVSNKSVVTGKILIH